MTKTDKTVIRKCLKWTVAGLIAWLVATQLIVPLLNGSMFVAGVLGAVFLSIISIVFIKNEVKSVFSAVNKNETENE